MRRLIQVAAVVAGLLACVVWGYLPWRAKRTADKYVAFRTAFEAQHKAIDGQFHQKDAVVNGIRWHYVDEGSPDGPVILFMHGLPEGWYSWHDVLPLIDHKYRLIAIDLKGYGRSDREDSNYEWHAVAKQTDDLMTSLGITKYYLVSHDWGTIIGSVMVSDHRDHILGYVRMEADLIQNKSASRIAGYIQKPQWLVFQNHWVGRQLMADAGWFIDTVYGLRMKKQFRKTDRDYLVYEFSRPGVADRVSSYFLNENRDLDTAIGGICSNSFAFPVLQLQADGDPAQPPAIFADLATKCPHVKIEWVKDASHFDNFDQPGQVADAINHFVHEVQP